MKLTYKAIARSAGYIARRTAGQFETSGWYYMDDINSHARMEVYPTEDKAYIACCINEGLIYV